MITTSRLVLSKISVTDAHFYFKLFNSEGWLTHIGNRNINTVEDAEAHIINNYLPSYDLYGYGSFTVFLKDNGIPIGSCGLYKRKQLDHPDIGFAFLPEYTLKGYAYEASEAVLRFAKEELTISTVLGITVSNNTASIKLLKKLGLREIGFYNTDENTEELLLFSNHSSKKKYTL